MTKRFFKQMIPFLYATFLLLFTLIGHGTALAQTSTRKPLKSGDEAAAKQALRTALQISKSEKDPHSRSVLFGEVASVQWKMGEQAGSKLSLQTAKTWAARITEPSMKDNAFEQISVAQCRVGDFVGAIDLIENIVLPEAKGLNQVRIASDILYAASAMK